MAARMVLELSDDGKFSFAGPVDNKPACYALLGLAFEAVVRYVPDRRIVTPSGPLPVPPREQ